MSPWWWVLVGLAAWLTPGVLVVLMLGWVLWRDPEKPAKHLKPPQVASNVEGAGRCGTGRATSLGSNKAGPPVADR